MIPKTRETKEIVFIKSVQRESDGMTVVVEGLVVVDLGVFRP